MNLAADELSCMPTCFVALCDGVTLIYLHICGQQLALRRLYFWEVRGVKIGPNIEGRFEALRGSILGSKMGPTSRPRGPQEAPRTPLEEAWQRRLFPDPFWGLFWLCFGPFGIVKIVLPSRRGATFYKNHCTRSGAPNRSQNDPQNELKLGPKWTPGGPRKAKSVVQSGARF